MSRVYETLDPYVRDPILVAKDALNQAESLEKEVARQVGMIRRDAENCEVKNYAQDLINLHEDVIELENILSIVKKFRAQGLPGFIDPVVNQIKGQSDRANRAFEDMKALGKLENCQVMLTPAARMKQILPQQIQQR